MIKKFLVWLPIIGFFVFSIHYYNIIKKILKNNPFDLIEKILLLKSILDQGNLRLNLWCGIQVISFLLIIRFIK